MISRRFLGLGAVGAVGAALLAGCDKLGFSSAPKASFQGVDLTGAAYARGFSLPDQHGRTRTLEDFKGKVVVVFFGFTQCPDVCPTTLAELAQVKKALGADGDKVQGVFITVDPERDKPELLKAYLESFDPGFVALRGSPEQLKEVAKEFKVYYAKVPGKTPDSYTMDHTAASFLFDPQGRVRVFSRYGAGATALMSDIKALLAGQ
ncbi:SCO family protein [Roseateles chitinivorans]|uniref:SCO family protein n=1 Tax=Roseateles chitinivorans TaxID=2917965 RepID=A0A2G9CFE5_9BURK|nr:SCO family protein [Roseateles chitinivorans]PIM55117.1 SCO family protein [Roseateles chitinivorans]